MNIKRVFFDMDECLLHSEEFHWTTAFNPADGFDFEIVFPDSKQKFQTSVRPSAKEALAIATKLVGEENVFILTYGTQDYAEEAMGKSGLGVPPERIFGRHHFQHWSNYHATSTPFDLAEQYNVLIDNEPPSARNAWRKQLFIGTHKYPQHYLQVDPYVGNPSNAPLEAKFLEDINNFFAKFK